MIFVASCVAAIGCGGCDPEDPSANNTPMSDAANNAGGDAGPGDGGDNNGGGDAANNGGGDAANNGDASTPGDGGTATDVGPQLDSSSPFDINDAGMVDCGGSPCACDNGIDDDGDGLIDGLDPECTGPYDNDEESFSTGIPGDNKDPVWQDCFFDGNSGSGDDKCRYKTGCLTGELPADDPDCQVSQACFDFCRPVTPNGCDCFGCCEVFDSNGMEYNVIIGGTCSTAKLGTAECTECVQTEACINECGRCELCLGKTINDLPADCFDDPNDPDMGGGADGGGSGGSTCDDGEVVCESSLDCPNGGYCQLGCCLNIVL